MQPRMLSSVALGLALVLSTACGSGSDSHSITGPDPQDAAISATINGVAWSSSAGVTANYQNGILAFAGTDGSQRALGVGLVPATGPGTYPLGAGQATNATYTEAGGLGWSAVSTRGTGVVTLTALSDTHAAGTFSFTLVSTTGLEGRSVANGKFDVSY